MKEKTIPTLIIASLIFLGGIVFVLASNHELKNKEVFDCNLIGNDVVFFKTSELVYVSSFLKKHPYGIAVIPDSCQINANTEILQCPNFHYSDYLDIFPECEKF